MSRKILSLIVAVAFVLTSFSSAFAATVPSDVTADFTKAVSKVQSLNVMIGDAGTGLFRPEDTIKRSEFAVVAVKAMGLNDTALISKGTTKFSDVAADHWATGYINAAVGAGIISGYPNGTFQPDKTINYAEAVSILIRMLGYGPVLAGKDMSAYVAKANEVGVTSGVVMAPTVGASRGNVAKLVSNTLDSKILKVSEYDKDGKALYSVGTTDEETLMAKKLDIHVVDDGTGSATVVADKEFFVAKTPALQSTATTSDATLTDTNNGGAPSSYKGFADSLNPDEYLGLNIKAWKNKDSKIVVAEVQNAASDVYTGLISKDDDKIKLDGKSISYGTATSNFVGYINATNSSATAMITFANVRDFLGDDKALATVVIKDGSIRFINAYAPKSALAYENGTVSYSETYTIKELNSGFIKAYKSVVADRKIQDIKDDATKKLKRFEFIKDGKAATIDDVKAGDVVTQVVNGNYERWYVSSTQVKDVLKSITGSGANRSFTVGATTTSFPAAFSNNYLLTVDNGDNYDTNTAGTKDLSKAYNKEMTIKLGFTGQIAYMSTSASTSTYYYGIFQSAVKNAVGSNGTANYVSIYKADGTKVSYGFEKDGDMVTATAATAWTSNFAASTMRDRASIKYAGAAPATQTFAGDLVEYQLTSDGKIKEGTFRSIQATGNGTLGHDSYTAAVLSVPTAISDSGVTVAGTKYFVNADTVMYNVYDLVYAGDPVRVIKYGTIENKPGIPMTIIHDGNIVKYLGVNGAENNGVPNSPVDALTSGTNGVVTGFGTDGDGEFATVNENGKVMKYNISGGRSLTSFLPYNPTNGNGTADAASNIFTGIEKGYYIEYTVNSSGKISSVTAATYANGSKIPVSTFMRNAIYKVLKVDTANTMVQVEQIDNNNMGIDVKYWFRYKSADLNVYDETAGKDSITGGKSISDINVDDFIWVNVGIADRSTDVTRIMKIKRDDIKAYR